VQLDRCAMMGYCAKVAAQDSLAWPGLSRSSRFSVLNLLSCATTKGLDWRGSSCCAASGLLTDDLVEPGRLSVVGEKKSSITKRSRRDPGDLWRTKRTFRS
jgi:hypothetical protein